MTPEQKAAAINAKVACAMAELYAMQAENRRAAQFGHVGRFLADDFRAVIDRLSLSHDAVLAFFSEK